MSKRLGRKRLYSIEKRGQTLAKTTGAALTGAVGSQTQHRDGQLITTEIIIDLASSKGAAYSFPTTGTGGSGPVAIGVSSSSGTHANCQVITLTNASNGYVTDGELFCAETPTGGGVHVGLYRGSALTGSGKHLSLGTEIIAPTAQEIGANQTFDIDSDIGGQHLYLVHTGSGDAVYTAGKFILRLKGYEAFSDL